MQPTSPMNECTCLYFTDYCPVHAGDIHPATMGPAILDAPNPYTFTEQNETYSFPFQEDIHAGFIFPQNSSPGFSTLGPHFGHHAVHLPMASDPGMQQSLPFESASAASFPSTSASTSISALPTEGWTDSPNHRFATSLTTTPIHPLIDQLSDHFTTVNAVETHGVPVGIASPMYQPTISNTPKEQWYTEYGVDRDANGLYNCPFAGCIKMNKRRDQLWEHWKAKHNGDPYRCGLCNKSWIYNGEKAHTCNAEMATCQICQKRVTRHHLTDHQKTRGCNNKRSTNGISATVIDYGRSL